jgi:hypothetical protein
MVLIEIDSNTILVKAMKTRTTGEMIRAYQKLIDCLCSAGVTPKMHILDNKCSAEFKERIQLNNMQYQLVPPNDHRRNIAEKVIQVFKAHFISIFVRCGQGVPTSFMGQAPWTGRTYSQHAPNLKNDAIGVSIRIPLGQTQL